MAPNRGSRISIRSAGCPSPFSDSHGAIYSTPVAYFIGYCIYFLVTLFIMIAWTTIRKKHPNAKKLLNVTYFVSLLFMLLGYALSIVATMLWECNTTDRSSYYDWVIAFTIFFRLSTYLLLVSITWNLNNLLLNQLNSTQSYFKIIQGVILGLMGMLTVAYIGLSCYNSYTDTRDGRYMYTFEIEEARLSVAYWVFFLLSIFATSALSISSVMSLRSRGLSGGHLLHWIVALAASMFIWLLFYVIKTGAALTNDYFGNEVFEAFSYIINTFQSASWIILLAIATKFAVFKNAGTGEVVTAPEANNQPTYPIGQPTYAPQLIPQQHYAFYNRGSRGQPMHNGTPSAPGNGTSYIVQIK